MQPRWREPALFSFLFFPSVVCWSSGLIKESLAMAALYFIVVVFLRIWSSKKIPPGFWLVLLAALWVLWGLKYYYLAVLLPIMTTELIMNRVVRPRIRRRKPLMDVAIWLIIFLIPVSLVSVLHPNFYPQRFLDVIVTNYETFQSISDPDDVVQYSGLAAEPLSILSHVPKALVVGLFRPFLWEATGTMKLIAAAENVVLLLLFAGFIAGSIRNARLGSPLSGAIVMYCIILAIFLALSTPNFGTLSRYRIGFLPCLVLMITAANPLTSWLASVIDRSDKPLVG